MYACGRSLDIFSLWMIVFLIALTGFFVASEFAIVKVRPSRIDQLIEEGNKKAVAAKHVITHLDEYLSANQLGITMTSLGLGWLGEPTVERALRPLFDEFHVPPSFAHGASFLVAFAAITFIHVVVGELAPKTIAIQKVETITLWAARHLCYFIASCIRLFGC
ncbi:hypothetical protein LR68_04045 [Anoxybacillus sp. BCO1]|nr:hypothetical protein LR68_04045 [Anoxybacillus sp. BCO1]